MKFVAQLRNQLTATQFVRSFENLAPEKGGHVTPNMTASAAEENIKQFLEKIPKFKSLL